MSCDVQKVVGPGPEMGSLLRKAKQLSKGFSFRRPPARHVGSFLVVSLPNRMITVSYPQSDALNPLWTPSIEEVNILIQVPISPRSMPKSSSNGPECYISSIQVGALSQQSFCSS